MTAEQRTRTPPESIAARTWLRRRRAVVALGLAGGLAVVAAWQLAGGSDPAAEDRPTTAWRGALLTADGRGLLLAYPKGCADGPDRVVVSEDAATVRVGIVQRPLRYGDCASSYQPTTVEARLPGPLGSRRLVDAHTGIEHHPVDAAGVLRPTFLPRGVPLTPTGEGPTTEAGPSGWRLVRAGRRVDRPGDRAGAGVRGPATGRVPAGGHGVRGWPAGPAVDPARRRWGVRPAVDRRRLDPAGLGGAGAPRRGAVDGGGAGPGRRVVALTARGRLRPAGLPPVHHRDAWRNGAVAVGELTGGAPVAEGERGAGPPASLVTRPTVRK